MSPDKRLRRRPGRTCQWRLERVELGAQAHLDAGLAQPGRRDELCLLRRPRRSWPAGAPWARRETTSNAAAHQRGRRLAGDEARADDHRLASPGSAPCSRRRKGRRRPCGPCAGSGSCAPSTGGRWGARGGEHAGRRRGTSWPPSSCTRRASRSKPDRAAPAAQRQRRVWRTRPRLRAAGRPARARRAAALGSGAGGCTAGAARRTTICTCVAAAGLVAVGCARRSARPGHPRR